MPLFDGPLENRPVDPSEEFNKQHNHFFTAQKLAGFDPGSAFGKIRWEGFSLEQRVSYHQVTLPFANQKAWVDVPRANTKTTKISPSRSPSSRPRRCA
jgi:hypothetical protein